MEKIEKTFTGILVHTRGVVNQTYHMNDRQGQSVSLVLEGIGAEKPEAWANATVTVIIEYDASRSVHID